MSTERPTILYVMDPLCGWCFGFSPVVMSLYESYRDRYDFKVVPGGMITGARVEPVAAMAGYILKAYTRVEEMSGVKFGQPYLDMLRAGTEISNSVPPCQALHVLQELQPGRGVEHAHQLQRALFMDGYSWNDRETYVHLARLFDLNPDRFLERWESQEAQYSTVQDFQWVQAAGITGFPCLVYQKGDQYLLIASGFQPQEAVEATIKRIEESMP